MIAHLIAAAVARGHIFATGSNTHGKLGINITYDQLAHSSFFHPINGLDGTGLHRVHMGPNHSFVTDVNYRLYGWGSNQYQQLGFEASRKAVEIPTLVPFFVGKKILYADGGEFHSIAVDTDWNIWTFGQNHSGALGRLDEGEPFGKIDTRNFHKNEKPILAHLQWGTTVILTNQNNVYVFGSCEHNMCLSLNASFYAIPTKLSLPFKTKHLYVGMRSIWFVSVDDKVYVAGTAHGGELCTGDVNDEIDDPRDITDNLPGRLLFVDCQMRHTLLMIENPETKAVEAYMCGNNSDGQFGMSVSHVFASPQMLYGMDGNIVNGTTTSMGTYILTDKGLYSAGRETSGELSMGSQGGHFQPYFDLVVSTWDLGKLNNVVAHSDYAFVYSEAAPSALLGGGQIAGAVVGAAVAVALLAVAAWLIARKCAQRSSYKKVAGSTAEQRSLAAEEQW